MLLKLVRNARSIQTNHALKKCSRSDASIFILKLGKNPFVYGL